MLILDECVPFSQNATCRVLIRPKQYNSLMKFLICPLALALLANTATAPAFYDSSPFGKDALQCINGECDAVIAKTTYQNRPAYKLTNGAVGAVIVPAIGRVMSFGKIGGPNLIWNAEPEQLAKTGWKNYGGDKAWLAPQSNWKLFHGANNWPPESVLDGEPLKADVLSGGKLQLTTGLSKTGIRLIRTMYFDENGEFVIEQTARKERGAPIKVGIWNVTQVVPGQAVFAPVATDSTYPDGTYIWDGKKVDGAQLVRPGLMKIVSSADGNTPKLGFDTPVAALASVRDGVAWLQRSARPVGEYPDGKNGNGFPTEIYINGDPKMYYQELEFLGPLQEYSVGTAYTHTVRWSLHNLPSTDTDSPETLATIQKLLLPVISAN